MDRQPIVSVGIIDGRNQVEGRLDGQFHADGIGYVSGGFIARAKDGQILLSTEAGLTVDESPLIRLTGGNDTQFRLFGVTIGNQFHWERSEDQVFRGNLVIVARPDGTITAIDEIPVESYLTSVISSEMRAEAPLEFLKAHAIISRSWLLTALERKKQPSKTHAPSSAGIPEGTDEIIRWYEREDHDIFDVCADDHCQRYQGITKILSKQAETAVKETSGKVITHQGKICDARFSKCCGGLSEEFPTAWDDGQVRYLATISDSNRTYPPARSEDQAQQWILSEPEAYCNVKDDSLLKNILPDFDRETTGFFRWTVTYGRRELEKILREKSGIDFGSLLDIIPVERGPSARIFRLRIVGSRKSVVVGKELEIRRWLSPSHLYSSAFVVEKEHGEDGLPIRFTLQGAGWGHGVGLCQIGAAAMASQGFSCEQILSHYFRGSHIEKLY